MNGELTDKLKHWAENDDSIYSILLVGSCARKTARADSDIDLVILTDNKDEMVSDISWTDIFGKPGKTAVEYYGECTSVRVWYQKGPEIEFGIVRPSWCRLPLDEGTQKVLTDGYRIIADRKGCFDKCPVRPLKEK